MSAEARVSIEAFPEPARRALHQLSRLVGSRPAWVVGGALRQARLGEEVGDLDLAVSAGALTLGQALARELPGASFVPLDEQRGICRVVWEIQIDIADLRAPGLAADLRLRDFTVNALAASLQDLALHGSATVEDATGGLQDLTARLVRPCGPGVIADDPLRALRAVRLAIRPGWRLDGTTEAAIREAAPRMSEVSTERVRDEMSGDPGRAHVGRRLPLARSARRR